MLLSHVRTFGMLLQRNSRSGQGFKPFQSKIAVTSKHIRTLSQLRVQSEVIADGDHIVKESASTASIRQKLVEFRKKAASQYKKPAYIIFTNKALESMLELMPKSATELTYLTPTGFKIFKEAYPEILDILSGGDGSTGVDSSALTPSIPDSSSAPTLSSYNTNSYEKEEIIAAPAWISLSSLSAEQQNAAQIVLSGQNVFITGSAGTGKSYLLKYIVQEMRTKFGEMSETDDTISAGESVVITAPTGVAAINVGGCTIHSFAGIGLGEKSDIFYYKSTILIDIQINSYMYMHTLEAVPVMN
jgi:chromosomal replication initiation ATPase DnaA